jgi:hypothetical protein
MGGEPREEYYVLDAGLAPEVHDRELAGAEEPGKRLWTDTQPLLGFGEGNQLRRHGDLQGEFLLACGRAHARAEASGRSSHGQDLTSQEPGVRRRGW